MTNFLILQSPQHNIQRPVIAAQYEICSEHSERIENQKFVTEMNDLKTSLNDQNRVFITSIIHFCTIIMLSGDEKRYLYP